MTWPLSQDYNEAIQNPAQCFADPELRQGEAETNALGLPAPRSGNFADVYAVVTGQRKWAVKCFTRQIPGLQERYQQISLHLKEVKLPFMVDFTFQQKGIRVRSDWYPILKMQWVEGFTLNQFVKTSLDKPQVLDVLCQLWVKLAGRLREANIAHCDLQHGNVLLVPGSKAGALQVKLVDYDGMCVPSLTLLKSIEVGHPAYQHPQRQREGVYSLEVDRFSHLVIYTALRALIAGGKPLWEKYDDGDNLLFRPSDYQAPARSALCSELRQSSSETTRKLSQVLVQGLGGPLDKVPLLESVVAPPTTSAIQAKRTPAPAPAAPQLPTEDSFASLAAGGSPSVQRKPKGKPRPIPFLIPGLAIAGGLVLVGAILAVVLSGKDAAEPTSPVAEAKPPSRVKDAKETVRPKTPPEIKPVSEPPPVPEQPPKVEPMPEPQPAARNEIEPGPAAAGPTLASGFVPLFNGKDLIGWKTHPSQPGNWRVTNGILVGSGPGSSHLYTTRGDYTDFELRVEGRINDGGDSGIFFRAPFGPRWKANAGLFPTGYEAQINATNRFDKRKTGSLFALGRGSFVDVTDTLAPPGQWFTLEVAAMGNHLTVKVNGQTTAAYTDEKASFTSGHIILQQWLPETVCEFRKIEIKESGEALETRLPHHAEQAESKPAQAFPVKVASGNWRIEGDELVQNSLATDVKLWFGDPKWMDYDFSAKAMRTRGNDAFNLLFRGQDGSPPATGYIFTLGGYENKSHLVNLRVNGRLILPRPADALPGKLMNNQWYSAKVSVRGSTAECYLDGKRVFARKINVSRFGSGFVGLGTWGTAYRFKDIKVTRPDQTVLLEGLPDLATEASNSPVARPQGDKRPPFHPDKDFGPLEAKPVTLRYTHEHSPRTLTLRTASLPAKAAGPAEYFELEGAEIARADGRGLPGVFTRLEITSCKVWSERDGEKTPFLEQTEQLGKRRAVQFLTIPSGRISEFGNPLATESLDPTLRTQWLDLCTRIAKGYELTLLTVPDGEIRPGGKWQSPLPLVLTDASGGRNQVMVFATCRYAGIRMDGRKRQAQIDITPASPFGPVRGPILGQITGRMFFAADQGFISAADLQVESPAQRLEVHLTRSAPNSPGAN